MISCSPRLRFGFDSTDVSGFRASDALAYFEVTGAIILRPNVFSSLLSGQYRSKVRVVID